MGPRHPPERRLLLEVKDLKIYFPVLRGLLLRKVADVKAVDGVSFDLKRGEVLGLVGESGCGKTTVGRAIIRLYKPTAGQIFFEGQDITDLKERQHEAPAQEDGLHLPGPLRFA